VKRRREARYFPKVLYTNINEEDIVFSAKRRGFLVSRRPYKFRRDILISLLIEFKS